jgi:hypothetical protein
VAFVHGVLVEEADPWFEGAGLGDLSRVSDPSLAHYRAFDLATTGVAALFHAPVWARGAVCALTYGFGRQPASLIRQLPGAFVVHGAQILAEFRHPSPSARPDYLELIRRAASVTIR